MCDKGFIWNPRTVEEVKLIKIITLAENENSYKYSSCAVDTVLFWIFFTINVGEIGVYFVYLHGYLKKKNAYSWNNSILNL